MCTLPLAPPPFPPRQLEVLHLLSPEQKAELLLRPEVAGLDNGTLSLIFNSLMEVYPGSRTGPNMTSGPWTGPGPSTALVPGHPAGPNMTSGPWTNPGPPGPGYDHNHTMEGYPDSDDYGYGYSDYYEYEYSDSHPPGFNQVLLIYNFKQCIYISQKIHNNNIYDII